MKAGMKQSIILLLVFMLGAIFACDDKEKIVGCGIRNHIYEDRLFIGTEYDTVYLFIAAGMPQEYIASVTFDVAGADNLTDSMHVYFSVYGRSNTDDPEPYKEFVWRSDTLIIWYSGGWPYLDHLPRQSSQMPLTPPCPPAYYRIDHIDIRHSNDVVIETHEDILY